MLKEFEQSLRRSVLFCAHVRLRGRNAKLFLVFTTEGRCAASITVQTLLPNSNVSDTNAMFQRRDFNVVARQIAVDSDQLNDPAYFLSNDI